MADKTKLDLFVYIGPNEGIKVKEAIALFREKAEFAILESLTKTDFPDPKNTDIDPEVYPKGRIFSDDFELRWEKRNGGYSCVLAVTTDCKWKPENLSDYFFETNEIANEFSRGSGGVIEDYSVFLRLEKDPSLGRSLKYECIQNGSTKGKLNPVLHLKRYRDARGQLIFWRYCKMEWKV